MGSLWRCPEPCSLRGAVGRAFSETSHNAQSRDATLRVRLVIESSAPELHSVHWETLPLLDSQQIAFSRYLSGMDCPRLCNSETSFASERNAAGAFKGREAVAQIDAAADNAALTITIIRAR